MMKQCLWSRVFHQSNYSWPARMYKCVEIISLQSVLQHCNPDFTSHVEFITNCPLCNRTNGKSKEDQLNIEPHIFFPTTHTFTE